MELLAKDASKRGPRGSYKPRAPKPQHRASDIDIVALNESAITKLPKTQNGYNCTLKQMTVFNELVWEHKAADALAKFPEQLLNDESFAKFLYIRGVEGGKTETVQAKAHTCCFGVCLQISWSSNFFRFPTYVSLTHTFLRDPTKKQQEIPPTRRPRIVARMRTAQLRNIWKWMTNWK